MNKRHEFMEDQSTGTDVCLCGKPKMHEVHPHKYSRLNNYLVVNVCVCSLPLHAAVHDQVKDSA